MDRRALALVAVLAAACSAPPPPPPSVARPPKNPSPAASHAATSRPAPEKEADEGPPPDPPIAMRWTLQLPSVAGQPGKVERLVVLESGDATWESAKGIGDGEIDEELSPAAPSDAPRPTRCKGHVGPVRHRRIVLAALRAMSGCDKAAAVDRLGHPVDEATTRVAVTSAGKVETCEVGRSGGRYAALEAVRAEVVGAICAGR
jgi:hypothetical protein